jgi:hypothetical protein
MGRTPRGREWDGTSRRMGWVAVAVVAPAACTASCLRRSAVHHHPTTPALVAMARSEEPTPTRRG